MHRDQTALMKLVYWGKDPEKDEAIALLLITHGASLYSSSSSFLHRAGFAGNLGVFRACLKAGSDPNEMLVEQRPLYAALGRYEKYAHLKSRDVPSESRVPERPLMVKELIEAGADVHLPVKGNGSKALHIAAY
ncbi:MAG: Ankyrin repeat protein [Acidobacteria bacterium OLB17]|nr:MAG: Ankyrin repeat protein [Acidobacteria bacterium OLB17]